MRAKGKHDPHGTSRNTSEMSQKWRKTIDIEQLKLIENNCYYLINAMNYRLFNTIENTRNFSISLYTKK